MWRTWRALAVIGVWLLAAALSGCEVSFTTASLSEVTMAKKVDSKSNLPSEKGDVFTPDSAVIYCTAKLSNAPSDTKIKAEWLATDVTGVEKDYVIDTIEVKAEGNQPLSFSLEKPSKGWPTGKYAVRLYVDGKPVQTVAFSVK